MKNKWVPDDSNNNYPQFLIPNISSFFETSRRMQIEENSVSKTPCIYLTIQLIVIKWQLSVTPKKLPDRRVFPFENVLKKIFFPLYLSSGAQKYISFLFIY